VTVDGTSAIAGGSGVPREQSIRGPIKVLVASGDLMVSDLLMTALGAGGFDARSSVPVGGNGSWRPDVALLEIDATDDHNAEKAELIGQIQGGGVPVVVMLRERTPASIEMCLNAGAATIVDTGSPFASLLEQLRRLTGGAVPGATLNSEIIPIPISGIEGDLRVDEPATRHAFLNVLTPRERAVLTAMMEGHSAEMIAKNAWVAVSTVRSQIKSILQKLGVNSQLAAVAMARRAEWQDGETTV